MAGKDKSKQQEESKDKSYPWPKPTIRGLNAADRYTWGQQTLAEALTIGRPSYRSNFPIME